MRVSVVVGCLSQNEALTFVKEFLTRFERKYGLSGKLEQRRASKSVNLRVQEQYGCAYVLSTSCRITRRSSRSSYHAGHGFYTRPGR